MGPTNLYDRMYSLYLDRVTSGDFELLIPQTSPLGPGTIDRIPVHKIIIAMGSPFLKYIIASKTYLGHKCFSFNEVQQITKHGRHCTATVQRLVEFLYTDKVTEYEDLNGNPNGGRLRQELEKLKKLATHFQVLSLEQYCQRRLAFLDLRQPVAKFEVNPGSGRELIDVSKVWKDSLELILGVEQSSKIMEEVKEKVVMRLVQCLTTEIKTTLENENGELVNLNIESVENCGSGSTAPVDQEDKLPNSVIPDNISTADKVGVTNLDPKDVDVISKDVLLETGCGLSLATNSVENGLVEIKMEDGLKQDAPNNTSELVEEKKKTEYMKTFVWEDDSFLLVSNEESVDKKEISPPQNTDLDLNPMSEEQLDILRTFYNTHQDLDTNSLAQLMAATNLSCVSILDWFQNRRNSDSSEVKDPVWGW